MMEKKNMKKKKRKKFNKKNTKFPQKGERTFHNKINFVIIQHPHELQAFSPNYQDLLNRI